MGIPITAKTRKERRRQRRSSFFSHLRLHPLFLLTGVWFACTGELFLFLLSTLVALQHECAHAFAAAKLGYKLNAVVLMPFGAVIDGDLRGISLKDEIFVALCGPLCNLVTAIFFVALWWFAPTTYAFTDTAFYSSLAIALVNLLPLYPLDGGRIFRCMLTRKFLKGEPRLSVAEKRAGKICKWTTLGGAGVLLLAFLLQCVAKQPNFTLLAFSLFLLVGGLGNRAAPSTYEKIDLAFVPALEKGVEIRRVAIGGDAPLKDVFPFLARGSYLVLEVYGEEGLLFQLPQNLLAKWFAEANTPYESLRSLYEREQSAQKRGKNV